MPNEAAVFLGLWEAASGKILTIFEGHTDPITGAVFSPELPAGNHLVRGQDRTALGD
jgi:hypothetical protein